MAERYRAAFETARQALSFATNVRYGGIFIGCILVMVALFLYPAVPSDRYGTPLISGSVFGAGILVILVSQLWGSVLEGQARLLEITIEVAVNSSLLLSNADRVELLELEAKAMKTGEDAPAKAA